MYSIIDIESSGGQFGEEKIIEIAIYKYDGRKVVDQFATLVNPEKNIQEFVQKLTGITNKMVKRAPHFHEIAKRVVEMTEGTTLVAHNADFDYRMLRQEFKELGYNYEAKLIDTINLSKHLLPEQKSYGLKQLTKSLAIPHQDVHRAHGDALATLELFKILLEKDVKKSIVEKSISNKFYSQYSPKILAVLEELPHDTGIYYIHNIHGKIIYIGASKDLNNQLHHTFMHHSILARKIQNKTDKITYELTGSLLIAKIKYLQERRSVKPALNKLDKWIKIPSETMNYPKKDMLITDKGRESNEKSFFVIRDNKCIGYGYYHLNNQINSEEKLRNRMTPIKESRLIRQHIIDFCEKQNSQSNSSSINGSQKKP